MKRNLLEAAEGLVKFSKSPYYSIKAVIAHRLKNGRPEALIEWENYDEKTWEPLYGPQSIANNSIVSSYVFELRSKTLKLLIK
jgi:hypothetical protein